MLIYKKKYDVNSFVFHNTIAVLIKYQTQKKLIVSTMSQAKKADFLTNWPMHKQTNTSSTSSVLHLLICCDYSKTKPKQRTLKATYARVPRILFIIPNQR